MFREGELTDMENSYLVSIIVPVYNTERYLTKCLKSILNQSYQNIELIVVNDGSLDGSEKIIEEIAKDDSRVHLYNKENGGLSSARNFGISKSHGDYIIFVDSDDYISDKLIEICLDDIHEYNSEIICYGFQMMINGEEAGVKCCNNEGHLVLSRDEAISLLIEESLIQGHACNKMFRKELFENIMFPIGKTYEDSYIMHNIFLKANTITHINIPLYYYCLRNDSICHTPSKSNLVDMVQSHIARYEDLNTLINKDDKVLLLKGIKKYYIKMRRYLQKDYDVLQIERWIKNTEKTIQITSYSYVDILFVVSTHSKGAIKIIYKIRDILYLAINKCKV